MFWISLFSQTGSELEYVSRHIGLEPHVVLTDNPEPVNYAGGLLRMPYKEIHEWLKTPGNVPDGSVITLHGYLHIIPKDVLDYLKPKNVLILNGHPAPIHYYPELKGKDPQYRLYAGIKAGRYKHWGSVIMEVDEGVDTGPLLVTSEQPVMRVPSKEQAMEIQRRSSYNMWVIALPEIFRRYSYGQDSTTYSS